MPPSTASPPTSVDAATQDRREREARIGGGGGSAPVGRPSPDGAGRSPEAPSLRPSGLERGARQASGAAFASSHSIEMRPRRLTRASSAQVTRVTQCPVPSSRTTAREMTALITLPPDKRSSAEVLVVAARRNPGCGELGSAPSNGGCRTVRPPPRRTPSNPREMKPSLCSGAEIL